MATCYVETPHNIREIERYVLTDGERIASEIMNARRCYFYDACSFRKHAQMEHPEYVFEFVKRDNGIMVITGCVLMELASHSGFLNAEYVEYMKKMYEAGIQVLILYEEDIFDILSLCFASNTVINRQLSLAVRAVKRPTGTMEDTLKENKSLRNEIFGDDITDGTLFRRFFGEVRSNKESGDNLGEELLAVCVHLMSNIPEVYDYKYVIMTEDKGAIGLVHKAAHNVLLYRNVRAFSALTTSRLAQRLYEETIISGKSQVEEMLSVGAAGATLKILGSEEYDLEPKEKTMTCSELAEKIITPNAIHINY